MKPEGMLSTKPSFNGQTSQAEQVPNSWGPGLTGLTYEVPEEGSDPVGQDEHEMSLK